MMETWLRVCLLLCTFGFVRELRPSEPYVSEFLLGPWRNITEETLNQDVYPVGTYSYLSLLVVVFLVTDLLRYKPLIVVSGLSGIVVYSILLWTESLAWLQASQFFYGLYMSTEVAYYTYIFAKVEHDKYGRVASYTRTAALVGRFVSGVTAQLLVSFKALDLRQLNYITFSSQIFATIWALFLPSVDNSIYFHNKETNPIIPSVSENVDSANGGKPQLKGLKLLWDHTKSSYSNKVVITWSAWYAVSSAGFYQIQSYMQLLWKEIDPEQENKYNGIVEAILTVLGAGAAFLGSYRSVGKRKNLYNIFPSLAAAIQAGAVLAASFATTLWLSYAGYIALGVVFHYMITIASTEIACKLSYNNCFGLVFGINTLVALALQSLLTVIVISDSGLALDIRGQFTSYAIYYIILCILATIAWIISYFIQRKKAQNAKTEEG